MVREKFPKLLCFSKIVCSPTLTFFLCFLIVPLIFFCLIFSKVWLFPTHPTLISAPEFERCFLWKINKKEWFWSSYGSWKIPQTFFIDLFFDYHINIFLHFLEGMIVPNSSNINLSVWIWVFFVMKNQQKRMIWGLIWFVTNSQTFLVFLFFDNSLFPNTYFFSLFFDFLEGIVVPTSSNINLSVWIWALVFMKNQQKRMIWGLIWFVKNSQSFFCFVFRRFLDTSAKNFLIKRKN